MQNSTPCFCQLGNWLDCVLSVCLKHTQGDVPSSCQKTSLLFRPSSIPKKNKGICGLVSLATLSSLQAHLLSLSNRALFRITRGETQASGSPPRPHGSGESTWPPRRAGPQAQAISRPLCPPQTHTHPVFLVPGLPPAHSPPWADVSAAEGPVTQFISQCLP